MADLGKAKEIFEFTLLLYQGIKNDCAATFNERQLIYKEVEEIRENFNKALSCEASPIFNITINGNADETQITETIRRIFKEANGR